MRLFIRVCDALASSSPLPSAVPLPSARLTRLLGLALYATVALVSLPTPTRATYIITFSQSGNNVVATGTGSIDTSGLALDFLTSTVPSLGPVAGHVLVGATALANITGYDGASGPGSFGPGGFILASSGTGELAGIQGSGGIIFVPQGYASGTQFNSSSTWDNTTFSKLGLTPGTYKWTWGTGIHADSFEVIIPSASAAPEPSSLILASMLIGTGGLWMAIRRRRVVAVAA